MIRQLRHVEPAAARPPDLVWDADSGEVIDALGDVVAHDVDRERLQGVIDKWRLLDTLKRRAAGSPLSLRVRPDDGLHHAGERVGFLLDEYRHPYLTVFNLAADGTVQYLYPIDDREAGPVAIDEPFDLFGQIEVTGPFGADHLVAVVTAAPANALHDHLRAFDGQRAAASLQALLPELLDGAHQLGITGLYTAP